MFILAMASWATPAGAAFPGANGQIVHNSCGFGSGTDCGLFLVNPDGSGNHQITHNPTSFPDPANGSQVRGRDRRPAWSADGRYIVYASERGTSFSDLQTDLYVLDIITGQQVQLTNTPTLDELAPAWSPNGARIAFIRAPSGPAADLGDLYVMDADGTDVSQLTTVSEANAPDWSPDGSKIAFAVQQPDSAHHFEIHTINPDGTGWEALTSSTPEQLRTSIDPSWSPDGSRILFGRADQSGICCRFAFNMFVMDADGTEPVELIDESNDGVDSTQPAWSPDGTKFAYTRGGSVTEDIFVSNAAGTSRVNITFGPLNQLEADWRPVSAPLSGYPRPKGATPTSVPLVVAHGQCAGAPNRTHGPPLVFDSCAPPLATSGSLTVGTPDANGMPAQFIGRVLYAVLPGNPATTADEADVRVELSASDVRLGSNLADYTGELQARVATRITDRGSGLDPATVQDLTIAFTAGCAPTLDENIGSDCGVSTTLDAVTPGMVVERHRAIWELDRVDVYDGGADGLASTQPNAVFLTQGVFVP